MLELHKQSEYPFSSPLVPCCKQSDQIVVEVNYSGMHVVTQTITVIQRAQNSSLTFDFCSSTSYVFYPV